MKLPLTEIEKQKLRAAHVHLAQVAHMTAGELSEVLDCEQARADILIGLAQFQQIPSIGPRAAQMMVHHLGFNCLDAVKNEEPAQLLDLFESRIGHRVDPCVEDQIRCIVHHANEPQSRLEWPDFTKARKTYRDSRGYPKDRPKF
ncbi:helix-hairpin-helix domain-containing protein [Pradoshia sp.]